MKEYSDNDKDFVPGAMIEFKDDADRWGGTLSLFPMMAKTCMCRCLEKIPADVLILESTENF